MNPLVRTLLKTAATCLYEVRNYTQNDRGSFCDEAIIINDILHKLWVTWGIRPYGDD